MTEETNERKQVFEKAPTEQQEAQTEFSESTETENAPIGAPAEEAPVIEEAIPAEQEEVPVIEEEPQE